jgi:hypothetical protein
MTSTPLKRSLAALAAAVVAAVVLYNGHAGLGSNAASIQDGTSNTIMFGEVRSSDVVLMADMGGQ